MTRLFKYMPQDFGKLTVKVLHMDLDFDVYDNHTDVISHLKLKALENIKSVELNAKNLEIHEVKCNQSQITYEYKKEEDKLHIQFEKEIEKDAEFTIATKTTCKPTKNILEGLYYDETPKNAPPTQITQCQQWGFQRIVPCIDDMAAKCTYTTTIKADKRYTNIITNGDVVQERKDIGNERVEIKYDNTITPMATYLFFLGVGTYATFTREFEYPNGKTFMLELLVPPDADKDKAMKALEILHHGIMWIYVFTGKDKYKDEEKRKKLWKLLAQREEKKRNNEDAIDLQKLREDIKQLASQLSCGYAYTGTVYREIGMQNSDFGGMENVGNTTITTNRIMPFKEMTDRAFEYLIAVKVHEFYHNLNGSEVTGWSPFEIWLNEAVTVHIENEHAAFVFGDIYSRLGITLGLLSPDRGTLMQDASAASMPIEPDGFNDPNELITSITYSKAPEFVRMIQTLLGKEKFVEGLALYHEKYKHSNATRKQWIESMEKVSNLNLQEMAQDWLKKTGFPTLQVKTEYNKETKTYTLELEQNGSWQFPFSFSLNNKEGKILYEDVAFVKEAKEQIVCKEVEEPAFVSLNREFSFYGKVKYRQNGTELRLQVQNDKDIVCRYLAWYELWDREKHKLLEDSNEEVDETLIDLYYQLLTDKELIQKTGVQFLAIFESVEDEKYAHHYQELYDVKQRINKAIALKYKEQLKNIYNECLTKGFNGDYITKEVAAIKNREMKNLCLSLLAKLDTPEIHSLIKDQFYNPSAATDKVAAFRAYINSSADDKISIIEEYQKEASQSLVSWETFLGSIGSSDSDDYLALIKKMEQSISFRIEQTNDQRALYATMAANKKKSLETEKGRNFLKEKILQLGVINEYTTLHLLKVFGNLDKMDEKLHVPLMHILVDILKTLDKEKTPSVYNTCKRMIVNLPKAKEAYEKERGIIRLS